MALQNASEHKGAVIAMDYNLVAEAFGKGWPFKWRINGWKRNNGASPKGVKHWVEILELYESSEPVLLVKPAYASISGHKRAKSMAMKETKPARSSKSYTMNSKRKRRKMKNKMKRSRNIYSSNPQRSYSA